jgi:poly(ADP-ribose) glycohydrolase ARH3
MTARIKDQFAGALLGLMTGDALGRPAKERTPEELLDQDAIGQEMLGGFYTEDTEMMINVAESLLEVGEVDPDDLAARFGAHLSPMRGYNPGALEVMYALQQGRDWRDANRIVFEDGSYGMGGSARAAPVGLFYHDVLDDLIEAAALSARPTHAHPLGEAGAVTVALAVALALRNETPRRLFETVQDTLAATIYVPLLPHLSQIDELLQVWPSPPEVVEALGGNRLTVQQCVPAGLYCVLRYPNSFEKAVSFAVSLGGDADTIAAIAGAIAGARHGARAIPKAWLAALENEERGRDCVRILAEDLYAAWHRLASA